MQQRVENLGGCTWLIRATFLVILLAGSVSRPALADPAGPQALDLKMTMTTSAHTSVGEPIVVHFTIKNTAPVGQVTFHAGEKNNEWYTYSLTDTNGRTIKAAPPPTLGVTQGLHHTPETSIPNGDRWEGDLVATRYLIVPGPGVYTLTIHTITSYHIEPDGAWYPEGRPSDMPLIESTHDFRFPLTVTAANPATLRATANALRLKLLGIGYGGQREPLTEQLFSLPESIALPIWRDLLTDPRTDSGVLADAANQLVSEPTAAKADMLATALWDGTQPIDATTNPWVSRAFLRMYEAASGPLKQHIRSLYAAHGISDPY